VYCNIRAVAKCLVNNTESTTSAKQQNADPSNAGRLGPGGSAGADSSSTIALGREALRGLCVLPAPLAAGRELPCPQRRHLHQDGRQGTFESLYRVHTNIHTHMGDAAYAPLYRVRGATQCRAMLGPACHARAAAHAYRNALLASVGACAAPPGRGTETMPCFRCFGEILHVLQIPQLQTL
jgi:hypothetical protein